MMKNTIDPKTTAKQRIFSILNKDFFGMSLYLLYDEIISKKVF